MTMCSFVMGEGRERCSLVNFFIEKGLHAQREEKQYDALPYTEYPEGLHHEKSTSLVHLPLAPT